MGQLEEEGKTCTIYLFFIEKLISLINNINLTNTYLNR
jgi:hypothetical protein